MPVLRTVKILTIGGSETVDEYPYPKGVNIGKANEMSPWKKAVFDANSRFQKLKDQGYSETLPKEEFNTDAKGNIKPMLAVPYNENKIEFPCYIQPKFDGVRCLVHEVDGEVLITSRNGKPYNIPRLKKWAEENRKYLPLDGELYNHKELTFQEIISAVKKVSPLTDKIHYVVYDIPTEGLTFEQRLQRLKKFGEKLKPDAPVSICPTMDVLIHAHLDMYHNEFVKLGYEGAIIRNKRGAYEFGFRSNDLIKMKKFDEEDFKIIDVVEATGRDEGTAIFVCECDGGVFSVKPQGTRLVRAMLLKKRDELIGKLLSVQYQGLTDGGMPRFPSGKVIRNYE